VQKAALFRQRQIQMAARVILVNRSQNRRWMAGGGGGWRGAGLGNQWRKMRRTLYPTDNLGKTGCTPKFFGEILGMSFWSSNSLLKLQNDALFTWWKLFGDFFMWFFLWFCKSALVKMLPQNIQFLKILKSLVFLGSKYQIITQLDH